MPIVLFRVDDRLIHGQVVVGWGNRLDPDRYVVVDDALAEATWEQELYALGVPEDTGVEFATVEEARDTLGEWSESALKTVVLFRDLETVERLSEGGELRGREVNLGGIHHKPGSTRVLSYLYLDEKDRERLRTIESREIDVTARDLPGSSRVGLERILSPGQ
ncbi:MAG: PTS sugar transporter subunit IIB [Longimicrobiales bacterium]|nr:PTS sugar transporter subunit IIB [Longimicrobiales bacterium]